MLYLQLPLIKPYVRFSRIRLSNHLLPEAFAFAWPSGIASTGVPGKIMEFIALPQSPFLCSLKSVMKVLPLSSPKVMLSLRYMRYYGQLRLPCRPSETSLPYIHQLPLPRHRQGSPVFIVVWLPLRVTPVTPEAHLSVLVVFVRIDASVFPLVGRGRQLHCVFRGYIWLR